MSLALDADALASPQAASPFHERRIAYFTELAERAPSEQTAPAVISALGGLALLGLLGGVGSGNPRAALELVTALPATGLGATVLTAPALLALIPFQDMRMDARDALFALAGSMARAGRLAWGMVPVLLFTMATSELAVPVFIFISLALGIATTRALYRGLSSAEARAALAEVATPHDLPIARLVSREMLIGGWCALHALVGLRLLVANLPF